MYWKNLTLWFSEVSNRELLELYIGNEYIDFTFCLFSIGLLTNKTIDSVMRFYDVGSHFSVLHVMKLEWAEEANSFWWLEHGRIVSWMNWNMRDSVSAGWFEKLIESWEGHSPLFITPLFLYTIIPYKVWFTNPRATVNS